MKARKRDERVEAEGRAEGLAQAKLEMAAAMLADGEPIEKIVKYSGLSEKDVLDLSETGSESAAK